MCVKGDASEKLFADNDIVSLQAHEESDLTNSDQECELIGKDNIVVIEPEASSESTTITDIVVYNHTQNQIDISMTAVFPDFYTRLMTS